MSDTISVVSVDEVKDYIGEDISDDMNIRNIERIIRTADAYLQGSIGEDYPKDDLRAKELALMICSDLYDNRGINEISGNMRKLVDDFSLQLRLELRRKSNESTF